jgi:hypothetical protein
MEKQSQTQTVSEKLCHIDAVSEEQCQYTIIALIRNYSLLNLPAMSQFKLSGIKNITIKTVSNNECHNCVRVKVSQLKLSGIKNVPIETVRNKECNN